MKTQPNAKEILKNISVETYREAYSRGVSLSVYLESIDPSTRYKDGLDAFERMLALSGVLTRGSRELGMSAVTYEEFKSNARALIPEWMRREYIFGATGKRVNTRGIFDTSDDIPGSSANPFSEAASVRAEQRLAPAIPLNAMVAVTTGIDNDAYRAYYLDNTTPGDYQSRRVNPGAEVPSMKLSGGEHTVRLAKFGRALKATYEQLRRMRIDKLAFLVQMMGIQAESDKVAAALDVLINGDGNSNAATSYNLTALDASAVAGTLTLKGWLAFKMKFANPYAMTTSLAQEDVALQMIMLNTGSANTPLVSLNGIGGVSAINPGLADNVRLGWTSDAPALKIVGIDSRVALEQVYEVGADISEIARFTSNQTQLLTIT